MVHVLGGMIMGEEVLKEVKNGYTLLSRIKYIWGSFTMSKIVRGSFHFKSHTSGIVTGGSSSESGENARMPGALTLNDPS